MEVLGTEDVGSLEVRFSKEEIFVAILGLNGEKVLGPDGFPIASWSFSWEYVKDEVMDFFKEFYEKKFVRSLNATFLVLIPKKGNVEDIKDYRPISLLGGLYKILAKVLANRLRRVIDKVVSPSQNAFMEGRQILDVTLIAKEAVDSMLRRNDGGVVCKLDIEKAYDHLNWEFVLEVMRRKGFGQRLLSWISWCMSTASFSIIINGLRLVFSKARGVLGKGDPLSSYLFVLGMDILRRLINNAKEGNFLSGCKIGGVGEEEQELSHLLYDDDTLLFCKDNPDHLTFIGWILMWFEALLRLKINLGKSEIFPIGGMENVEALTAVLGCKASLLPTMYLGLPLGPPHKSVGIWDPIEERFRRRLATWKLQYISKGGRVALIRSALSNLPIYFMSLFRISSLACKRLEKIKRDFLWGGGNLEKKPHLVNCATVCTDKKVGGWGVRGLHKLNKALLGKWIWRFANERNSLWREAIRREFGEMQGGWCSGECRNSFGTGLWKEIRKDWEVVLLIAKFVIGDGSRVSFWKDVWVGEEALCKAFSTLFSLAVRKEALIREVWDTWNEGGWAPRFSRPFNDWELIEVENFLLMIQPWRVVSNREDMLVLKWGNSGFYSVKLLYEVFSCFISLEPFSPLKGGLLCLGGVLGKGDDSGSTQKERKTLSQLMLPL